MSYSIDGVQQFGPNLVVKILSKSSIAWQDIINVQFYYYIYIKVGSRKPIFFFSVLCGFFVFFEFLLCLRYPFWINHTSRREESKK